MHRRCLEARGGGDGGASSAAAGAAPCAAPMQQQLLWRLVHRNGRRLCPAGQAAGARPTFHGRLLHHGLQGHVGGLPRGRLRRVRRGRLVRRRRRALRLLNVCGQLLPGSVVLGLAILAAVGELGAAAGQDSGGGRSAQRSMLGDGGLAAWGKQGCSETRRTAAAAAAAGRPLPWRAGPRSSTQHWGGRSTRSKRNASGGPGRRLTPGARPLPRCRGAAPPDPPPAAWPRPPPPPPPRGCSPACLRPPAGLHPRDRCRRAGGLAGWQAWREAELWRQLARQGRWETGGKTPRRGRAEAEPSSGRPLTRHPVLVLLQLLLLPGQLVARVAQVALPPRQLALLLRQPLCRRYKGAAAAASEPRGRGRRVGGAAAEQRQTREGEGAHGRHAAAAEDGPASQPARASGGASGDTNRQQAAGSRQRQQKASPSRLRTRLPSSCSCLRRRSSSFFTASAEGGGLAPGMVARAAGSTPSPGGVFSDPGAEGGWVGAEAGTELAGSADGGGAAAGSVRGGERSSAAAPRLGDTLRLLLRLLLWLGLRLRLRPLVRLRDLRAAASLAAAAVRSWQAAARHQQPEQAAGAPPARAWAAQQAAAEAWSCGEAPARPTWRASRGGGACRRGRRRRTAPPCRASCSRMI